MTDEPIDMTTAILSSIRDELRELRTSVETGFAGVDRRLASVETVLVDLDGRVGLMEHAMHDMVRQLATHDRRLDSVETRLP